MQGFEHDRIHAGNEWKEIYKDRVSFLFFPSDSFFKTSNLINRFTLLIIFLLHFLEYYPPLLITLSSYSKSLYLTTSSTKTYHVVHRITDPPLDPLQKAS